ncbi:hypothetical protein D7X12_33595 [Corallococcus sicarius]|uniref:Uncharacterized protein n=1 Tax=Corallococcus sicarius TaxID=2316726 RepID=A0A3A8N0W5_9BACT|nr:hypothetical protein D7X12_33595 [Corallococcus sicarius]
MTVSLSGGRGGIGLFVMGQWHLLMKVFEVCLFVRETWVLLREFASSWARQLLRSDFEGCRARSSLIHQ